MTSPCCEKEHQPPQILVFGSIVQDLVSYVDRFPRPGESVRGNCFKTFCGGKGANQAVMVAKLGTRVKMVGMVGHKNDVFADPAIESMRSFGVDTEYVRRSETASTATATIFLRKSDGENCIVVCLGACMELSSKQAQAAEAEIAKSKIVMCQSEADQTGNLELFKIAKKYGVTTFFNPAPGREDLDHRIVTLTDIICTNQSEAEFVTGLKLSTREDFEKAAKEMLKLGPKVAIVTLGPDGVIVAKGTENGKIDISHIPTEKVQAVDTIGAGDCFCGSLAHFYVENPTEEITEMVKKASRIATISVQRQGSQSAYPTRQELIKLGIL